MGGLLEHVTGLACWVGGTPCVWGGGGGGGGVAAACDWVSVLGGGYRGLQVGWHKFATKIRACAHFGGDFELKIPRTANSCRKFVPTNLQTSVHHVGGLLEHVTSVAYKNTIMKCHPRVIKIPLTLPPSQLLLEGVAVHYDVPVIHATLYPL